MAWRRLAVQQIQRRQTGAEPGKAILLHGAPPAANREIGVPGFQVVRARRCFRSLACSCRVLSGGKCTPIYASRRKFDFVKRVLWTFWGGENRVGHGSTGATRGRSEVAAARRQPRYLLR